MVLEDEEDCRTTSKQEFVKNQLQANARFDGHLLIHDGLQKELAKNESGLDPVLIGKLSRPEDNQPLPAPGPTKWRIDDTDRSVLIAEGGGAAPGGGGGAK